MMKAPAFRRTLLLAMLAAVLAVHINFQEVEAGVSDAMKKAKARKNKKSKPLAGFHEFCGGMDNSTVCQTYTLFSPSKSSGEAGIPCFWTRIEVNLPKYSSWTMTNSSILLYGNHPGNQTCSLSDVYVAGNDIMELEAPTLDCFRQAGCSCDGLSPEANQKLNWQPVTKILAKPFKRTACRNARTFLYIKVNCRLVSRDYKYTSDLDVQQDYESYEDYYGQTVYEPPLALSINWTREYVNETHYPDRRNGIKEYCRSGANNSPAGWNRWFLTIMTGLSGILVLLAVLAALVWSLVVGVKKLMLKLKKKPVATEDGLDKAESGSLQPDTQGGDEDHELTLEAAGAKLFGEKHKPKSFLARLFHIDHWQGRSRWYTAVLVSAVGLYIAGIIFEPKIKAQTAYDQAISPSLRGAIMDLTGYLEFNDWFSFVRKVANLLLVIMLCIFWGACVFLALLFNLSARPPVGEHKSVYWVKLVVSILAMVILDVGLVLYLLGSWELADRWTQPLAYYFLVISTLVLFIVCHVQLVKLVVIGEKATSSSPRVGDVAQRLALSAALDNNLETEAEAVELLEALKKEQGITDAFEYLSTCNATVDDAKPDKDTASSRSGSSPKIKSNKDAADSDGKEDDKPLKEKLMHVVHWIKAALAEEERNFRYSPWFIAPMIIAFVLLIFFFIRIMSVANNIYSCIGAGDCPSWSKINQAVIPIISATAHSILSADSPSQVIKQLNSALINTPAMDVLSGLQSNFSIQEASDYMFYVNLYDSIDVTAFLDDNVTAFSLNSANGPGGSISYSVRVNDEMPRNLTAERTTSVQTSLGTFEFSVNDTTGRYYNDVYVDGVSWAEFVWNTAYYQAQLQYLGGDYYLASCNPTAFQAYVVDAADITIQEFQFSEQLEKVSNLLGVTPLQFVSQLYTAALGPALGDICDYGEYYLGSSAQDGNSNLAEVLDKVVYSATAEQAKKNDTASSADQDTGDSIVDNFNKQRNKLKKYEKKGREFYHKLEWSYRIGSIVGPCIAMVVSMISLVVIMGVYKKAVIRLRKQMAINKVLEALPEGKGLVQGKTLMQRKFLADAYALDHGDAEESIQMFTMIELLKDQALPPAIFFYGIVFSTVLLQLIFCSVVFGALFTLLFHKWFWSHVLPFLISLVIAVLFSKLFVSVFISMAVGQLIAPGGKIVSMSAWIAYFIMFSFAYIVLGVLYAMVRLILILVGGLVMSCRIDKCLNAVGKALDPAFNSFMAMMKMQTELKAFTDAEHDTAEQLRQGRPTADN